MAEHAVRCGCGHVWVIECARDAEGRLVHRAGATRCPACGARGAVDREPTVTVPREWTERAGG